MVFTIIKYYFIENSCFFSLCYCFPSNRKGFGASYSLILLIPVYGYLFSSFLIFPSFFSHSLFVGCQCHIHFHSSVAWIGRCYTHRVRRMCFRVPASPFIYCMTLNTAYKRYMMISLWSIL